MFPFLIFPARDLNFSFQILPDRVPGGFQGLGGFAQIIVVFIENPFHVQTDRRIQFVRDFGCRRGSEAGRHLFVFGQKTGEILFVQHAGTFQKIEQFSDVARIIVGFQRFDLLRFQPVLVLFQPVAVGDLVDVTFMFPKRRNSNLHYIQAMEEVFPELCGSVHSNLFAGLNGAAPSGKCSGGQQKMLDLLTGGPQTLEQLVAAAGLGIGEASVMLLELQMKGFVQMNAAQQYFLI